MGVWGGVACVAHVGPGLTWVWVWECEEVSAPGRRWRLHVKREAASVMAAMRASGGGLHMYGPGPRSKVLRPWTSGRSG